MNELIQQLKSWRGRERLLSLAWAGARLLAVVAAGLSVCCFVDWWIDRSRDVPFALRLLMTVLQIGIAAGTAILLAARVQVPSLIQLALKAERALPQVGHRFVTAIQLNRPGAQIDGMSPELIGAVTKEAGEMARGVNLVGLADHAPGRKAIYLALPILSLAALFAGLNFPLFSALLGRQALLPLDIPRSVAVENFTPPLWPAGDEVVLSFRVTGAWDKNANGVARVEYAGQPSEEYAVEFAAEEGDAGIFLAKLPASSAPFTFRARIRDGRTRGLNGVEFAPRPVVKDLNAWLVLPAYVDPAGKTRFERFQPQGEVTALPDCSLRVEVGTSKPVAKAEVVVYSRAPTNVEIVAGRYPMTLADDRLAAGAVVPIPPRPSAYRIEVVDDHGFANTNPPRRGITPAADEPPRVNLLPEVLKDPRDVGPLEDYEVSGMPLVLGGQVQVGYAARSPLGLSRAAIVYRVNEGDWITLPLNRTVAEADKLGSFVPELGVFENSGPYGVVEFYSLPAAGPDTPPGLEAGGRYNFQTGALLKKLPNGSTAKLAVGDRVEFYVALWDRNPAANRPAGTSETRLKTVVTQAQLEDWTRQRDQSRDRLRQLEEKQRGVFTPTKP
jgi:hypothetical protein